MRPVATVLGAAILTLLPAIGHAADATAILRDPSGAAVGHMEFTSTPSGFVVIAIVIAALPAGTHAIHIHETGDCSAGDFTSAGGHLAFGMDHGVMASAGPHPGDLPNLEVGATGTLAVTYFNDRISLDADAPNTLFDSDGSAVVVHAGADDYASQPSGDAGGRIACGVIEAIR